MKKAMMTLLSTIFVMQISTGAAFAHSQDSLQDVVTDSLYGGLAGAIIGVATLAFVDEPGDHADNIKVGAGIGVILGSIYGTVKVSRSVAQWENGTMTAQFPAVQLDVDASSNRVVPLWKLNLLHIAY